MPSTGPMACPVDGATLTMSERSGIEIDYCPTCRGVWLDRGELDKIIQRAAADASPPPPPPQAPPPQQQQQQQAAPWGQQPGYQQPQQGYGQPYYGKRKKSFIENLFD